MNRTAQFIPRALRGLARRLEGEAPQQRVHREFLDWITYAVAGMTDPGNFYCFDYAIRRLPSDGPVLEIGTWCGRSAIALSYFLDVHHRNNRLITCDAWEYERGRDNPCLGDSLVAHKTLRAFLKASYVRNARTFCPQRLPHTVEADADVFFDIWHAGREVLDVFDRPTQLGGRFSFCFIDGNHSYSACRSDFENCDRFLESGGFLLFDDSADGTAWDVCCVVQEVLDGGRYVLEMKNPNYLFRKR
jgi:predicted O-methyltransferase YrrM